MAWFAELSAQRQAGFNGPQALSWGDIDSWARAAEVRLTRFEIRALTALDRVYREAAAAAAEKRKASR